MKKLLTILLIFTSMSVMAQFGMEKARNTHTFITITNNEYTIFETTNGSQFIKCVSPTTGKTYPVWIGVLTTKIYEGKPVRKSKSGKFFILVISANTHNPYCKYIKIQP